METIGLVLIVGAPVALGTGWCIKKIIDFAKTRSTIRAAERNGWVHIGHIKYMYIYPIDGGGGMQVELAHFGRFGLRSEPEPTPGDPTIRTHFYDRGFIMFSTNTTPPTAILNDPQISRLPQEIEQLWYYLKPISATLTVGVTNTVISYLNRPMNLFVPNARISDRVRRTFNIEDPSYIIGYCAQDRRQEFNYHAVHTLNLQGDANCHLANFASYTMVNSKSIKDLRKKTGRTDLSYKNFRPQVVFNGKRPYIEHNAVALKIGELEFYDVKPCTHKDTINENFGPPTQESRYFRYLFGEGEDDLFDNPTNIYGYLSRNWPLSRTNRVAYQNSNDPVFGINFEFGNATPIPNEALNNIEKDFLVFAKYEPTHRGVEEAAL